MKNKQFKSLSIAIVVILIGFSGYLGFKPLFEFISNGALREFTVAIYGTVFTVILTMFLLNKQTEIEEQKDRGQNVFVKKSELFSKVINELKEIIEDGKIEQKEMNVLRFVLLELNIFAGDKTIEEFVKFYSKVNEFYEQNSDDITVDLTNKQITELFILLNEFAAQCRLDLGLSDKKIDSELFSLSKTIIKGTGELVRNKQENKFKSENGKTAYEIILDAAKALNTKGVVYMKVNDVYNEIIKEYPEFKKPTVRIYMSAFSTNHPSKKYYPRPSDRKDEDWFEFDEQKKIFKFIK